MEENEELSFEEIESLVHRFEEALEDNHAPYFDVEEFEEIIDYYDSAMNKPKLVIALRTAQTIHPYHIQFKIHDAQLLIVNKRYGQALNLLNNLLEIEPENTAILQNLAFVHSQMGKHTQAIDLHLKSIEKGIDPTEAYNLIAYEYQSVQQYSKAIDYLKLSLEVSPEDEGSLYELLFCYEIDNRMEESLAFFTHFVDENPYSFVAWFNLGITYSNLGLYEKAIEAYDYVLAIDDSYSSAYFNKANALIFLNSTTPTALPISTKPMPLFS